MGLGEVARVGVDVAATLLAVLMWARARRRLRPTWVLLGVAATFSALVFSFAIRPRLTGAYLQPDLACVALVAGATAGTRGRWEQLFPHAAQAVDPTPDEPSNVAAARNVSGVLVIAAYLVLELLFTGAILGVPV